MGIQIEVSFKDKERAKQKGAFWDADRKTWYIPEKKRISDFSEWLPEEAGKIVKSPFFIAKSKRVCWKCAKETELIAIGCERFLTLDYYDDESDEPVWRQENYLTLFSDITYLPRQIVSLIQSRFPFFRHTYSKTVDGYYWANNCVHCKALQGDWFNHHEPDGAFSPLSPEEARRIELILVEVPYDFPLAGGYSIGDSTDFIEHYAKRR